MISARSVAVPSASSTLLFASGGLAAPQANLQSAPVAGGLTVSAVGSVTVAADEAYVVIMPEQRYGPSGPEQMTDADRQGIREGLAEIGVSDEAIEFTNFAIYGPSGISVEVALEDLDERSQPILDVVEEVIRRSESHGVIYALSPENCESALSVARREAIPSAERAADDLAEALGVGRGEVMGALEYPLVNLPYGLAPAGSMSCGSQPSAPYPSPLSFDAEPEVELSVGLQITYAIR